MHNFKPWYRRSGQLSDRRSGNRRSHLREQVGRKHMAGSSRSWWDRARQMVQLLALVIDEAIKLTGVLRGH